LAYNTGFWPFSTAVAVRWPMAHVFWRPGRPGPSRPPEAVFIVLVRSVAYGTRFWATRHARAVSDSRCRFDPFRPFGGLELTFLGVPARPARLGLPGRFHPSCPSGGLWLTFFGRPGTPGPSRPPGAVFTRIGRFVAYSARFRASRHARAGSASPGRFHPSWPSCGP